MAHRAMRVAVGSLIWILSASVAGAQPAAGTMIDETTAEQVKDYLPPEIYEHYAKGEYRNPVIDFPAEKFRFDDAFNAATEKNRTTIVLDASKQPVDKTTGQRPEYLIGLPFPDINASDPDGGYKVLWNLAYAYYAGGNSHNWTMLNWLGPKARNRMAVQDVHFLYYDGQPRQYSPAENPRNLLFQLLAVTASPADLQGTAALSYRFKDPTKRDMSWAYAPAIRRVRAVSPANRSDGFLGSDQSQDDGFFFDGKPEDFTWKIVDHREGLRLVDPSSVNGDVKREKLPDGGWRTVSYNNDQAVGFMRDDWDGIAWAPSGAALAMRKFWIIEGTPKDEYYLYGKIQLWIDDQSWAGAWNRKYSWKGELLNVYQVLGFATHDFDEDERWWGSTMGFQGSENIKMNRATVSGMNGPGGNVANDRRIPLEPGYFDYNSLNRFGK